MLLLRSVFLCVLILASLSPVTSIQFVCTFAHCMFHSLGRILLRLYKLTCANNLEASAIYFAVLF